MTLIYRFSFNIMLLVLLLSACQSSEKKAEDSIRKSPYHTETEDNFSVNIHLPGNVSNLNAILTNGANESSILDPNVHITLMDLDPVSFGLRPYVAEDKAIIQENEDKVIFNFTIREEASWDNGYPINAKDFAFTLKIIKNPLVEATSIRSYFEFVEDVIIDPENLKKLTIVCNKKYFLAETALSLIQIYPSYFYDPKGLMSDISIPELNDVKNIEKLKSNPRLIDFAKDFNQQFNFEPEMIVGGGPYKVVEFESHKYVKLELKENWWGNKLDMDYIKAYPKYLFYKIIDDDNNAILSLKQQELDVMTYIPSDRFPELKNAVGLDQVFTFSTPNSMTYRFICFNMNSPELSDVRVRKAISHLMDKQYLIDKITNGLASPVDGPINPVKSYYHKNLPQIEFDVEKAKALLSEAGWKDTDGDNVLDKMIEGRKVSMELKFVYPQGKKFFEDVAKILSDEAERVGIKIETYSTEWASMQDDLHKRNFDLTILGWAQSPLPEDMKQIWSTESATYDGSNLSGFGDEESDYLIEKIRTTMNEKDRYQLYMDLQEKIVKEHPYIFLISPAMCTAISKRFTNCSATSLRPGYFAKQFRLKTQ